MSTKCLSPFQALSGNEDLIGNEECIDVCHDVTVLSHNDALCVLIEQQNLDWTLLIIVRLHGSLISC